jgi:hypothetical protein
LKRVEIVQIAETLQTSAGGGGEKW